MLRIVCRDPLHCYDPRHWFSRHQPHDNSFGAAGLVLLEVHPYKPKLLRDDTKTSVVHETPDTKKVLPV